MNNIAVFFQKYDRNFFIKIFKKIYFALFLKSNKRRIDYLRKAGAHIGNGCHILKVSMFGTEPCLIEIGNNVYFSGGDTNLITHDGSIPRTYDMGIAEKRYDSFGKIKIGNNCFIGMRCIILKGVTIGDNCVIGAGSVVTKDIPSGSVACGVPARVIETTKELYEKNKGNLDDTHGINGYKKRLYLEKKYNLTGDVSNT